MRVAVQLLFLAMAGTTGVMLAGVELTGNVIDASGAALPAEIELRREGDSTIARFGYG
ncbi:MAG TPA: hypothetical protein VE621_11295 [Bryobacteraceae bacterium]|jgi:hypothetical protein|nr:hypothetical protein [Bryobacteraceae bacterium]